MDVRKNVRCCDYFRAGRVFRYAKAKAAYAVRLVDERGALLVERNAAAATAELEADADRSLDNPHEGEDGEGECGPVDERGVALAREDRPERPRDRNAGGQITLGGGECVGRGGGLEEEAEESA